MLEVGSKFEFSGFKITVVKSDKPQKANVERVADIMAKDLYEGVLKGKYGKKKIWFWW